MQKTFSLAQIDEVAVEILKQLTDRKLIIFNADMGAGKTTTISAICKQLGVSPTAVSSPTFSIINEYEAADGKSVYHLDLYRIKNLEEAIAAGVEDVLRSGDICLIEWASVISQIIPSDTMQVSLTVVKNAERLLEIK